MTAAPPLDATTWITGVAILVLLALSAFFSAAETALTAASRGKLRARADRDDGVGDKGAEKALRLAEDNERLIGGLLLGNNIAKILAASLATALFMRHLGDAGVVVATLVLTAMVLVFAEVLPKTFAITLPEAVAARLAAPVTLVLTVLSPVVALVRVVVRQILLVFGLRTDPDTQMYSVREEIAGALALGESEGTLAPEDRHRLLGALDLSDRTVEEVMRHRSQIEMLDAGADPNDLITQALASSHTRLPLYRGERDNVVGIVHSKDLLRAVQKFLREGDGRLGSVSDLDIQSVAMKPYFVPETTPLDEQMRAFLKRRAHVALVVDEYGELRGLITLEDILEEIVGQITDEFDVATEFALHRSEAGDVVVDGAMSIRDLNRAMDWSLPDGAANTVAGLVIHEAQVIPAEGQMFSFHGFRFEVAARKDNRITRLKIRPL